jgi:Skp family chaperone for outer membrane proteins
MNKFNFLPIGLGLWLLISPAAAQILPGATNIADKVGQVILPERIVPDADSTNPTASRPPRAERPELPQEIKKRIDRFEKSRESYLARQQELLRNLNVKGATDEERARVRAQLQGLRDEWLDRARAFREEARTRMKDLQAELPKHRDALNDAKEGALDTIRDHKRRGDK